MNTYLVSYVEQITDVEIEARIQATSYSEMIKILESNGGQILVTGCNMVPSLAVKKEDTTNKKIMNIVNAICNAQATDYKSFNKVELARQLLDIANVPSNASIQEIPLDWNQQVVVMFSVPNDNNYYSLFAGIGKDTGLFHFELAIDGETKNGEFAWYEVTIKLHIDYFKNGQSTNGQKEGIL